VAFLLDTNVAIHLRDGDPVVTQRVAALDGAVLISVVTRVDWRAASIGSRRTRLYAGRGSMPC
jgi:predicted nucleic acid-binding protein